MKKSELRQMIRGILHEELVSKKYLKEAAGNERVAFMDFTGNSFQFEDLYKKSMAADGFEGTVNSVEDTRMRAVHDAVNSGADVVLYTCDDDYVYSCSSIVDKPNFKVRLVKIR
jgi:hypothetical protein